MTLKFVSLATLAAAALSLSAAQALAEQKHGGQKFSLEQCRAAVLKSHAGTIVKVEAKNEAGEVRYEFDVESDDGKSWDIECSSRTGKVVEVEQEVKAADGAFAAKAKMDEAKAREVALKKHPGEVVEVEYEMEPDGSASYEFDIRGADGKEHKVEVDATSGAIVEDNEELFQIGKE